MYICIYIQNEHGAICKYILWIMNEYRYCSEFKARQRCLHRLQLESMLPNTFVDFVRTHWISSPAVQFSFRTHQIKHVITCPCWKAVPQSFHHKLRHPVALNRVQHSATIGWEALPLPLPLPRPRSFTFGNWRQTQQRTSETHTRIIHLLNHSFTSFTLDSLFHCNCGQKWIQVRAERATMGISPFRLLLSGARFSLRPRIPRISTQRRASRCRLAKLSMSTQCRLVQICQND